MLRYMQKKDLLMFKTLLIATLSLFLSAACSVKEFNSGVDSITSDATNAFEESKHV